MGSYSIEMHGSDIEVKAVDDPRFIQMNVERLLSGLTDPKVIGFDAKKATYSDTDGISTEDIVIVLCSTTFCLIIHTCPSVDEIVRLVNGVHEVCFVTLLGGVALREMHVEQLAARVLKKPSFCRSSLSHICDEVGVEYQGCATGRVESIAVESLCPTILSEEQVKVVISDAYACQQVGSKLLASL